MFQERSSAYERELRARSQVIRETEMGNMNKKQRSESSNLVSPFPSSFVLAFVPSRPCRLRSRLALHSA